MDLVEASARAFDAVQRHPWERARLNAVCSLIARHRPLVPGDIVLDVGCGDTYVVEQLARRFPGVQFHAVDTAFTVEMIQHLRGRLQGASVSLHGSLDEVQDLPAGSIAMVLLMDVMEHVPDDRAFLHDVAMRRCISPDTRFVITVPAYEWLFSSHDRLLGHYRRYSMPMLMRQIAAAGLTVGEHGRFFGSLLPVRALQTIRERVFGAPSAPATGLVSWRSGEAAARVIAAALDLDARLSMALGRAGIQLPGLSHFAVCRTSA
jgi:2-polyprenyl-3-methyl-5-hydroxy-6-metoxy-1,4-benzoquinol methylase